MSERRRHDRPRQPDDDGDRFEFELPGPSDDVGGRPQDHDEADAGEITDMGTGDDPPRSGE